MKRLPSLAVMILGLSFCSAASFGPRAAAHEATVRAAFGYHRVWQARLSANADSTAVVARNVRLHDGKKRNIAVVLAGNNGGNCSPGDPVSPARTYAFNTSNGQRLWSASTRGPSRCTTAAPAIGNGFVYSPGLDGRIHKYAITSGKEVTSGPWPERYTRMPDVEKESANLVVSGRWLYATTSGFIGDAGHYEAHVVAINLDTGHKNVWNSLCSNIHRLLGPKPG